MNDNHLPWQDEDDNFFNNTDPDSAPTIPHILRVPAPDQAQNAAPTLASGMPPVTPQRMGAGSHELPDQIARDRDRKRRTRDRSRRASEWAWVVVALAMFGVTLVISLSVFLVLRTSQADDFQENEGMSAASSTAVVIIPTAVPNVEQLTIDPVGEEPTPDANQFGIEAWDGEERFTILLMGWDRRPTDPPDAAYRTDTMMLVSLDPVTQQIGVLSIPRDLYVNIPGYSQLQRINSAYVLGELRQPGYGPELAIQTVQYNLGMRVHDYLIVDFNAFIKVVDAIGGITVDVPYNISDPQYPDMYYGYDPFYITAGEHHLDGTTALKYARTRHNSNDFRRAERQQQVIFAIRDQILSVGNLPQVVVSAPSIWASVQEGVRTGLTFDQLIRLGWYAKDIPLENIHTGVIDEQYITFYTTPTGSSVVIPNRYALGGLMVQVFGQSYNQ
ncbi:MAG: LCP family protein [Anaerolineae bacterium]|nr:LCP family protein [Anaerolineae bacterium]